MVPDVRWQGTIHLPDRDSATGARSPHLTPASGSRSGGIVTIPLRRPTMAFSPCAADGAKYAGGANTFFLRLVSGDNQVGGRLQFCANHATLTLDHLSDHFIKVSEGERFLEYSDPTECANCGGDLAPGTVTFYGNTYPRGMAEAQWFGKVCPNCVI